MSPDVSTVVVFETEWGWQGMRGFWDAGDRCVENPSSRTHVMGAHHRAWIILKHR